MKYAFRHKRKIRAKASENQPLSTTFYPYHMQLGLCRTLPILRVWLCRGAVDNRAEKSPRAADFSIPSPRYPTKYLFIFAHSNERSFVRPTALRMLSVAVVTTQPSTRPVWTLPHIELHPNVDLPYAGTSFSSNHTNMTARQEEKRAYERATVLAVPTCEIHVIGQQ